MDMFPLHSLASDYSDTSTLYATSHTCTLPPSTPPHLAGSQQLFQTWLLLGDIYDGIIERPASIPEDLVGALGGEVLREGWEGGGEGLVDGWAPWGGGGLSHTNDRKAHSPPPSPRLTALPLIYLK